MHVFEEMKAYVRFQEADAVLLRELWASVRPRTRDISAAFYDRVLEFEAARSVFEDDAQVRRLRRTLEGWLEELLCGPHDEAYYERRRRIGEKHVSVKLPHRFMITAMEVVQEELCRIAGEAFGSDETVAVCSAIRKISMLDLAIMTGTFLGARVDGEAQDMAAVIVEHLPAPAILLDHDGRIVTATDAARDAMGGDPVGRLWQEAVFPDVASREDLVEAVRAAGRGGEGAEFPRVDATVGGVVRSWRLRVVPIEHPRLAVMLLAEEITEVLAEAARLRRMETLAQIGSMSAAVAHELRNPLAGISGAIQVMSSSMPESDPRRGVMSKVRDQIGRLDRMVRDLLAFARPAQPRLVRVDLGDVARAVVELHQRDGGRPDVRIEGRGQALADADLVHRVVLNLVQNAAAAVDSDTGGVVVRVGDGFVEVADDGPGVKSEDTERIFEPFVTTKTTGTGLGLAICRNAAEAMGGAVRLVPSERGAVFRLSLPVLTAEA